MKSKYIFLCLIIILNWWLLDGNNYLSLFLASQPSKTELSVASDKQPLPSVTTPQLPELEIKQFSPTDPPLPEPSGPMGYTTNHIEGFQAADPTAGIILIPTPAANVRGTAETEFPLKLPKGRKEMQPNLAITYSNEGNNGWLGLGWDLDLPNITIDTRWGVPRFDPLNETETYLLNGAQLSPVAHRGPIRPRSEALNFHLRVEGSFSQIIRHGDQPQQYWWEVLNRDGSRHYYGGLPDSGVMDEAVLRDPSGNIAHWALVESRDVYDNFIRYSYTQVTDNGLAVSNVPGYQLYPDRVTYTGNGATEGPFQVTFIRDRQLGESLRKDISIDARLGFKRVQADRLRRIEISKDNSLVRSYELTYQEGAFYKTLLSSISELDRNGAVFYRHDFNYYDEVRYDGAYQPFGAEQQWDIASDQVEVDFVNPVPLFEGKTSALGGSSSSSFTGGSAATFGPIGSLVSKEFTVGGNFALGNSSAEGLIAMVDLNGDGLPDKVFREGDALWYRPNLAGNGTFGFGGKHPVLGINRFSSIKTSITSFGFEANITPVFVGYDNTTLKSTTECYFSDFNGDELMDIAYRGKVYFNHLNSDGDPVFTLSSADTPSPISVGEPLDSNLITFDPAEQEALIDQTPLHDVVRSWEAPCTGTIAINAPVRLLEDTSPEGQSYTRGDGVRVAIQRNGNSLWSANIEPDNFNAITPANVDALTVNKGDHIYFRVQSIFDGAYDQVYWDPEITYINEDQELIDANNKAVFKFQASEDFLLSSCQSVVMPLDGKISIEGIFSKPATTDSLKLAIFKNDDQVIFMEDFAWDSIVNQSINLEDVTIAENDELIFRIISTTNIDWPAINWMPLVYYTSADDGSPVMGANGEHLLSFCPAVDYAMYSQPWEKPTRWIVPDSLPLTVALPDDFANDGNLPDGFVTLSVKGFSRLLAKTTFEVTNGNLPDLSPIITDSLILGDTLFIEYHTRSIELGAALQGITAKVTFDSISSEVSAGLYSGRSEDDLLFGPQYRGWGQFGYNGNRERANQPIMENLLVIPEIEIDSSDLEDIEDADDLGSLGDPTQADFILFYADPKTESWRGYDELTYLQADRISSSRMGEDDILLAPTTSTGIGASAPNLLSEAKIHAVAGGLSAGPGSLGASHAWNDSKSLLDVIDFNGDDYPDVVSTTKIQYTDSRGGLLRQAIPYSFGNHVSHSEATGVTLGGAFVNSSPSNAGDSSGKGSNRRSSRVKSKVKKTGKKSQAATRSAKTGAGISGNFTVDNDETEHSWLDINGDGLVDKVYKDGRVALNYGYRFGALENWGFTDIRKGVSTDYGGGFGINYANNSIAAGVSMSRTDNHSTSGFQDVNGDGLIDRVRWDDTAVWVSLNTGNSFSAEIRWTGGERLDEGDATAESANAAFTICIPIFFVRVCINPSTSIGQGVSRVLTEMTDINGDGFPDHLRSAADGELKVKISTIGKTNLLREVKRPLGSSFSIDYELVGNDQGLPFGKWVMSTAEINDGLPGDGADLIKSRFRYNNGYYDRHEREFYGFETVIEDQLDTENGDELYRSFVATYDQSNFYNKGLLLSEFVQDAVGNKFTETQYSYSLKDVETGSDLAPALSTSDIGTAFPALVETANLYYEGESSAGLQSRITYQYNLYGNVILTTDYGDGSPEDLKITTITYHEPDDIYLKNIPETEEIAGSDGILRKQTSVIDAYGNVLTLHRFLADGSSADTDMTYDAFGNLITLTQPANEQGQRMVYSFTYDQELNTYLEQTTDSYGYTSQSRYDPISGKLLEATDINGQRTEYTLDDRGRIFTITRPYELAEGLPYTITFEYESQTVPAYTKARHYDPETGEDIVLLQFVDGLGRAVQNKKTTALFSGAGQADQLVMTVSGADFYDAFGRPVRSHYPGTESLASAEIFSGYVDPVSPTLTTYDVLDRLVNIQLPDNSESHYEYSIGQDQSGQAALLASLYDGLDNRRDTYKDVRGRTRALVEYGPEGEIWTNFQYNAIDELLTTTDHEGNETIYEYDPLGRITKVHHPDEGTTENVYDLADNLVQTITGNIRATIPNEGAIHYTYDYERLVQIDYPKNVQNQVKLQYGGAGAEYNRTGKVWLREDASGGEEYFYDVQGEVVKTIRTILINEANVRTFVSEAAYDTWGRIQQMVYPDGEIVNYHYNKAGNLQKMEGEKLGHQYDYVTQIGYDKFEDRVYLAYGNGTKNTYKYEADRRRLDKMTVLKAGGKTILDCDYTYDVMSNILSIRNTATPDDLGGPSQHQYVYDELYRMIEATGSWQGMDHQEDYAQLLTYDNLNNLKRKSQTHRSNGEEVRSNTFDFIFEYEGSRPHSPTKVGGKSFQFDGNGNQLGYRGEAASFDYRQQIWDEENRLVGVSDNGYISQYTYDAQSNRAIKSHGGMQGVFVDGAPAGAINHKDNYTAYVSPFMTAEELSFTKHYYIEGQRILSKRGTGKFNNKFWPSRGISAGGLNYTLRLQQLIESLRQYYTALGIPPGPPTMPGYYGQPAYTGNPLNIPVNNSPYLSAPIGWPGPPGPPDPNGPPGPPTWFPDSLSNANVGGGYGFEGNGVFIETEQFYYHGDHLGSSAYITDYSGEVRQHTEYFPSGQVFVSETSTTTQQHYLFNGKELDAEAGLYYYGARYYDATTSLWQSVDPLATDYAQWSPYAYTFQNPVVYIDQDGREGELPSVLKTVKRKRRPVRNQNSTATSATGAFTSTIVWPPNEGFTGTDTHWELIPAGTMLSRFGYEKGSYLSPKGTPYEERALAPGTLSLKPYFEYEVTEPIWTKKGTIAAWFDQKGGGIQLKLPKGETVEQLIAENKLKRTLKRKPLRERRQRRPVRRVVN
ncbi:MAG: hypothetical protein DHS20C18_20400 [Saprospiraceae bacterium]|nr:MAG: hypothetical protein DHS20C18_20400 [Saprospiraceae bacterium]